MATETLTVTLGHCRFEKREGQWFKAHGSGDVPVSVAHWHTAALDEVSRLTSELDRVRKLMNTYGQHLGYCSTQHMTSAECDCGYEAALGVTPDATTRREG